MGNSKRRYFPKSVAWFCSCYQKWKIYLTANHNQGFQSNYSQNDNTKWSKVFGKFFHPGLNESFSRVKICHQNNVSGWSKVFHFHLLPSKILCFTFLITGSGLVGNAICFNKTEKCDMCVCGAGPCSMHMKSFSPYRSYQLIIMLQRSVKRSPQALPNIVVWTKSVYFFIENWKHLYLWAWRSRIPWSLAAPPIWVRL